MSLYKTRPGDSPAIIARRHGTSVAALLTANPHKPTKVVDGKRTWQGLHFNERLHMPTGVGALGDDVGVGDALSDTINALISLGGPCKQANVSFVCVIQRTLGLVVDGKYGPGTATAARARVPNAPAGCSPTPSWWVRGQSACPTATGGGTPASTTTTTTAASSGGAPSAAAIAINALIAAGGPCLQANVALVCAAQRAMGFVPGAGVDGKWGSNAATKARTFVSNAPAGCDPRPAWWAPAGQSNCSGAQPPPIASTTTTTTTTAAPPAASAAVLALVGINPCLQANVEIVRGAQRALGLDADGKYGTGTATAARRLVPSAPAGCSPAPLWWGARGTVVQVGPTTPSTTTPTAGTPAPAAVLMLAAINPCLQVNVEIVRNAQGALGLTRDGKYGTDTATVARRLVPTAPAACSPTPTWWGAKGVSVPAGLPATDTEAARIQAQLDAAIREAARLAAEAKAASDLAATKAQADAAAELARVAAEKTSEALRLANEERARATTQAELAAAAEKVRAAEAAKALSDKAALDAANKGGTALVTPEKKPISTGAIVAGAVGLAAIVGLIALAASGKKSTSTRTTITRPARRSPRKSARRAAPKRKPAKRKSSSKRKKSAKRKR